MNKHDQLFTRTERDRSKYHDITKDDLLIDKVIVAVAICAWVYVAYLLSSTGA